MRSKVSAPPLTYVPLISYFGGLLARELHPDKVIRAHTSICIEMMPFSQLSSIPMANPLQEALQPSILLIILYEPITTSGSNLGPINLI